MAGDDDAVPTPKIDSTSPYYIGSNGVPEAKISNVVLRRDNYDDWRNSMRMSLKSRRKFGFIDGSIKKPTDPFYLENWEVVHCTLVQWIRNTIDPSLHDTISYVEDASVLWNDLAEQFSVVDGTVIHNLKTQLHNCVQTKGMDVTTYYGKLKVIWDSLVVHEPPFACHCGGCKCNIGPDATKRLDNERLHQFFMGLDSSLYGNIRSQQLQLDPLPSLARAYHAVLQEERLRAPSQTVVDAGDVAAFATPRQPLFCQFCDTRGHEPSACYIKLNRFPDWWGDRPRTLADLRRVRAARRNRGGSGSSAGSRDTSGATAAASGSGSGAAADRVVQANMVSGVSMNSVLTSDRLSGMCFWIIDTGASNHVTGDLSCLMDCHTIAARPVGLPNGQRVESTIMGSAYINSSLSLSRDRSSKTTIGVGELRDGLYWIRACAPSTDIHQVTNGDKFAKRGRKCIFVGYPSDKKGWKMYDLETKSYFVSRDVVFYETVFPFSTTPSPNVPSPTVVSDEPFNGSLSADESDTHTGGEGAGPATAETGQGPAATGPDMGDTGQGQDTTGTLDTGLENMGTGSALNPDEHNNQTTADNMGKGRRIKFPNSRLQGYVLRTTRNPSQSSSSSTTSPSSSGTPYDLANYINCNSFSEQHRSFIAAITSGVEPPTFKEAIRDNGWCEAMKAEIDALERNETWELTDLPVDKKALGCRWVYKIKYKSDGTVERLKARLVVFGNHQVEGLDYGETFAPVVKMVTIRAFLTVAAVNNWELHQMDVHNAFLHGDLDEEVYMRLPPGFSRGKEGKVCRLKKSLYGLRQAPRCWFAKLTAALKDFGFVQSYSDYSLFSFARDTVRLFVLIYVDDLVIAGNDSAAITKFKSYLGECFHMKDLGKLKYFLGLEVSRSREGIYLSQRKYALDIIAETGLLGSKPAATPIEQNHRLGLASGPLCDDAEAYRRLIGRLVYLAVTRPDLSYAVHILSRFLSNPRREHMAAAHRVVRYLKGSPGQGILLRADRPLSISGWCDSDWGGCPTSRRSITGWFVTLGDSPISWKTKKQQTVSLSSVEAEYRSMTQLVCELKWLKGLLLSLDVPVTAPIPIFSDSKSALDLARNPVFHERTKHIEIDCHFIRDAIVDGLVTPTHVSTNEQLADIFTMALGVPQFTYLLRKLGILDLHAPA
ncbi:uncharacterized protein LOC141641774 [Silene latifolia]|uniref:uncharacterized protein LOC141641774 n=1 Tax=Silene latifolia TaxID=37657 RepID=UPI003D77DC19